MQPDDPRHGTNVGYSYGGCRDECCRRAHSRQINLWRMGRSQQLIPATGTHRRIEALMALGWSRARLSELLGHQRDYLAKMVGQELVLDSTAQKIAALYDRLCMTKPAPSAAVTKVRNGAALRRYAPPLAWNDIDDPAEQPKGVGTSTADRADVLADVDSWGGNATDAARALGIDRATLQTWAQRHGCSELYRRLAGREAMRGNQFTEGAA